MSYNLCIFVNTIENGLRIYLKNVTCNLQKEFQIQFFKILKKGGIKRKKRLNR